MGELSLPDGLEVPVPLVAPVVLDTSIFSEMSMKHIENRINSQLTDSVCYRKHV